MHLTKNRMAALCPCKLTRTFQRVSRQVSEILTTTIFDRLKRKPCAPFSTKYPGCRVASIFARQVGKEEATYLGRSKETLFALRVSTK